MEENVVLTMRDISKTFPGVKALQHVDFTLRKGEIHALMGENGAGKSTLIRMVNALETPTSGNVWVEGKDIEKRVTELLDFVNAGGSSTTTSNFSPFSSSSGRSSKTSSQRNFTVPSRPFRLAFLLACRTAVSDASTPRTLCAPAIPAFRAKEPVCVKQSRTFAPLQSFWIARRLYF